MELIVDDFEDKAIFFNARYIGQVTAAADRLIEGFTGVATAVIMDINRKYIGLAIAIGVFKAGAGSAEGVPIEQAHHSGTS